MIISLIVAMDEKGGIGKEGELPWHISQDLQHFKEVTMGHHLIMGRKTFQSIGKRLPGRTMIILTRNPDFRAEECLVVHSFPEALSLAEARGEEEVFIIGGASVYREALPMADQLYLTRVHTDAKADTFFPTFDLKSWKLKDERHFSAKGPNKYPFTIQRYIRSREDPGS
ncbi:MAG: dihydrofolate reductase [Anaerolineales bacterium]|nr:dihydrofolate reductase [Anaerolineales bacterium]MBS3753523.1 dihydrofolate reductase [Anaerolineales bacterium]